LFSNFTKLHAFFYRLTGGRIGAQMAGAPILLLVTKGRKSGQRRVSPLIYLKTDRGFAIVASHAGADKHPAWYLNILAANGEAELYVGPDHLQVRAETVDAERHAALWPRLVDVYGDYALYQERTSREIPVVEMLPA
jgi:deazaflavin-dependent oxidoreductase (nitroreductase family)